jgi:methylglutamate dehydrogenase subunit B
MRIDCPFCGLRDAQEFAYLGDASPKRPDPSAPDAADAFFDYVYLRDNPAGPLAELWYHTSGCRAWLVVERDTRTHEILGTSLAAAPDPAGERDGEN